MHLSPNSDADAAETLAQQIEDVIGNNTELTHGEILLACMIVLGNTLISIRCRDCRDVAAKAVKKDLPRSIVAALTHAINRDANEPPTNEHIH
jgi:hypothetical protein